MRINFVKSLRFRIPLLIVLGIMPPATAAIMGTGQYIKTLVNDSTKNILALEAQSLEVSASSWLKMNVLALKNLSRQTAIESLKSQASERILTEFTDTYQDIYLAHTIGLDGINLARSDGQSLQDYSNQIYYKNAIGGQDISDRISLDPTSNKPSLCLATPLKKDTVISGVTTICTLLNQLAESVAAIQLGETGYGFIVDNRGQALAYPDRELFSEAGLKDLSDYPPVQYLLAGNEGYFAFTDDGGIPWVVQINLLDNGWGVIILQHRAEAFAQAVYLRNIAMIIVVLALSAVGLLTWFLANTLIKPIHQIAQDSSDFAAGKLDTMIVVQRQDELGFLSRSLNRMAQQLKDSFMAIEEHNIKLDRLLARANEAEQEERIAREKLQLEVQNFQAQLEPLSQRDLTVRFDVTDGDIGTVADYYNKTIQDLQQIVAEVTTVTDIVTTDSSKNVIIELSEGTLQQTAKMTTVLSQVQQMTESIQLIAATAQEAETTIKQATETVQKSDASLNATVERIVILGESTTAAKEQVQKLGKASRRISKAVELIRKIALQTNVLAVNASIEATRAGQEGMGFNVIAEEVQSLAVRSAKTANEIEQLVLEIQTEMSKVVEVMDKSHQEILVGSKSMQETRTSLQQVSNASLEIERPIEIINKMATKQFQTSQNVAATMEDLAVIINTTSASANDVSDSFGELLQVSRKLQDSISQFKIN